MARIIFQNANLFDGNESPKPGSQVIVDGNRIHSVGQGDVESAGADRRVDLADLIVVDGDPTENVGELNKDLV